jgi:SNF family Na+-dependent transporter
MPAPRDAQSHDDLRDGRDETPAERADRNWNEVLQELRVMQTGTQILTGFLLALAFQPAFSDLTEQQRTFYLVLVVLSALSSIIALAPVALHRWLFRQQAKRKVVSFGHAALVAALVTVSLLLVGVVGFVFDVVVDDRSAIVSMVALGVVILGLWVAAPLALRVRHGADS